MNAESRAGWPGWTRHLAILPALLPLLPKVTCPFCFAAYIGLMSSLGLGFMTKEQVLVPLIGAALLLTLASVAWSTRSHRKPWPLAVAVAGTGLVVAGRLIWNNPLALNAGVALLVAGAFWNLWLKRPRREPLIQLSVLSRPER